jgi:hypothetical protein
MSSHRNLGMICVSIKDLHFQLYRVKTEGYSVDILHRTGPIMVNMQLMIRPGFFHLIIKLILKS